MGRKAVFFDIDGTLIDNNFKVPKSTIKALKELRENGHLAFICTGRAKAMVPEDLMELGFDGIVGACGTYGELNGQVIYNIELSREVVEKAIKVFREYGICCVLEGEKFIYAEESEIKGPLLEVLSRLVESCNGRFKMTIEQDYQINKLTCNSDKRCDFKIIYEDLKDDFDFIYHNDFMIEVVPKGYSKAKGIELMIRHLGIDIKDTYAFGDSLNDLEMLKYVKYGIAMGNSVPEILEVIPYKTDRIENDGIYNALKEFKLI